MTDPRRNLPSASAFGRYAACPGSFGMERQAREANQLALEPSPEALSGLRIHRALAGEALEPALTPEEGDLLAECLRLEDELINTTFAGEVPVIERERRIWCHDPRDLRPLFSGQFDLVARRDERILLIDFKTGWGELTPATRNWQLRALVALLAGEYLEGPPPEITAALITPRLGRAAVQVVKYEQGDALEALSACIELARRIQVEGQPLHASEESCRHCPAAAICPEGRKLVANLAMLSFSHGSAELVTGDQLAWFLEQCGPAEQVIAMGKALARRRLEADPNAVPGWKLKPGVMHQKIVDVGGVWERASINYGIKPEAFTKACSMTKTDLKELVRTELPVKGKAINDITSQLISGLTEDKQTAPTLERIK